MRDAEFYALSNAHNKTARLLDEYIMSTDYPLQEARIYVKSIVEMFSYIPFFTIFFRHFMLKKAIEKKREIERRNGIQRVKVA